MKLCTDAPNSVTFFESLKVVLINVFSVLMMSAKLATLGFFKIKVLLNKGCVVTNKIYHVTQIRIWWEKSFFFLRDVRGGGGGGRLALGLDVTFDTSVAKYLELNILENNTYVGRSYLKKGGKVGVFCAPPNS